MVVAYALAGTVDIDLQNDSLGKDKDGNDVYLAMISGHQLKKLTMLLKQLLLLNYSVKNMKLYLTDNERWNEIQTSNDALYTFGMINQLTFKTHHSLKDYHKNQVTVEPLIRSYV